jgi:hypothetical protein
LNLPPYCGGGYKSCIKGVVLLYFFQGGICGLNLPNCRFFIYWCWLVQIIH